MALVKYVNGDNLSRAFRTIRAMVSSALNEKQDKALVVTVTNNSGTYTADKTFAEITEAHNAGKQVIAKCNNMVMALTDISASYVGFAAGMDYGNMAMMMTSAGQVYVDDYTFLTSSSMSNHNNSGSAHEALFDGKLDKFGGTLTGPLTLSGAPVADLDAATKKYVDDQSMIKGEYTGDMNTLITPGMYELSDNTHLPENAVNGQCLVIKGSDYSLVQIVTGHNATGMMYWRCAPILNGSAVWTSWREVYDSYNKPGDTKTATLTTSGWAQGSDGRFYQTVSVSGVAADTPVVTVDVALTGTDLDADAAVLEGWQEPSSHNVKQGAGALTFYAYNIPAVNIPINVGVF